MNLKGLIKEEISAYNNSVFTDLPLELFQKLRMRKFSDEANRSHMKLYKAKDGKDYIISKEINRDVFRVSTLDGEQIAVAVFDDDNAGYFTGYETSQSIMVQPEYRRLGLATALTDFAETIYGKPYRPTKVLSEPMQGFVKNRFNTTS
jgi:ribosomal protein S18 acetylase RimI-like enzyme